MRDITTTCTDGVAEIVFCRPPVNATDEQSWTEIAAAFTALRDDRDVRVAILTACGSRAFMAGQDLRSDPFSMDGKAPSRLVDPGSVVRDAMWAVYDCAVPVVAAVNGPAIGGGLALAALCDIIVASDTATFGTTEINVGLLGASAQLTRLVGTYRAREMFLTGKVVSAQQLADWGAVSRVVPPDELMAEARAIASDLAAKSPIALRLAKESLNRVEGLPLKDAYRLEQDYTTRLRTFEDAAEATRAFLEKRPPTWRWR